MVDEGWREEVRGIGLFNIHKDTPILIHSIPLKAFTGPQSEIQSFKKQIKMKEQYK